jgi:hypothetical protein
MRKRLIIGAVVVIGLSGAVWGMVRAQEGDEDPAHVLTLLSVDAGRPALFQLLAPGDDPVTEHFTPRLDVPLDLDQPPAVIYVAVENTGWSRGAVGLIDEDMLDPDATYVALEVWERLGRLVLRDDGQGVSFPLVYLEDLDGDETPGFRFDAVIDQKRLFRIYRVVESGGLAIWGQTAAWDNDRLITGRASYTIASEPVFGDLLLDFHIIALPEPAATPTPTPTPEPVTPTATPESVMPIPTATPES